MKTLSHQGNQYFITFIDDFSRKSFTYFINTKDQAFNKFREFKSQVEKETGRHIKFLRTDRGGEYTSNYFQSYLKNHGIQHQLTAPYSPQQNGVAERFNRTIIEMAKSMMHNANLPYTFWAEAIYTATYIRNQCISKTFDNKSITPEELWTGHKPSVRHLRTFGCDAYALINTYQHKLEPKAEKLTFVGYSIESKAYRLWNPKTRKIVISRNVKFNENSISQSHLTKIETPIETEIETPIEIETPNDQIEKQHTEIEIEIPTPKTKSKSRMQKQIESDLGSYWQSNNEEDNAPTQISNVTIPHQL
jgi:transposase InsO family protein